MFTAKSSPSFQYLVTTGFSFRGKFVFGTKVIDIHMTERSNLGNLAKVHDHMCKSLHSVIISLRLLLQK